MARRHVLIGIGPGAIAAAEAIRGADAGAEIVVVGADPHGYYSRPGLAYYLANEIPEKWLRPFSAEDLAGLGLTIVNERADGIDARRAPGDARERPGARLRPPAASPPDPRPSPPGCRAPSWTAWSSWTTSTTRATSSAGCAGAKAAVVVGGGITALEIVEGLHAHGVHVDYFMRQDRYWSNVLSEIRVSHRGAGTGRARACESTTSPSSPASSAATAAWPPSRPATASGSPASSSRSRSACTPASSWLGRPDSRASEGSWSTSTCARATRTSIAAGDVAESADPATGRRTMEVLWNSAVHKGRVAGLNMARSRSPRTRRACPSTSPDWPASRRRSSAPWAAATDADLEGLSRGDSQTWSELGSRGDREAQTGDARVRLAVGRAHPRRRGRHGRPDSVVPAAGPHRGARRRGRHRGGPQGAGGADRRARSEGCWARAGRSSAVPRRGRESSGTRSSRSSR